MYPLGVTPFEPAKVIVFEAVTAVLLGLFFSKKRQKISFHPLVAAIFLVIFLLCAIDLIIHRSGVSFWGNPFRMQGTFLLWCLLIFAFLSSQILHFRLPTSILTGILVIQLIASVLMQMTVDGRAVGTLGEPNALAGAVVFMLPFLFMMDAKGKLGRVWQVGGVILGILIILLSGSRSGMIAVFLEGLFFCLMRFAHLSIGKAVIVALVVFLFSLYLPFTQKQTVYENRSEVWSTALVAGYEHPILGWGFGNTEIALRQYNIKLYNRLRGYYVDSSHNIFLDWWIQGGFVGLASLVSLIYLSFRILIKKGETLCLALLLGLLTVMSFNPVSVVTLVQFWWVLGQASEISGRKLMG